MSKLVNIVGNRYGKLQVQSRDGNTKAGQARWLCLCDCGNERIVNGAKLRNGHTKSCGCLKKDAARCRTKDLSGEKYNRLIVLRMTGYRKSHATCECQCDCGNVIIAIAYEVRTGHTKSCGCLNDEYRRVANLKHGHTETNSASRTYHSWRSMKQRCYDAKVKEYMHYGAKGVTVCQRWIDSFEAFLEDMKERPESMSIDRINPYGNYEPNNCRWTDAKTQANNQRRHCSAPDGSVT